MKEDHPRSTSDFISKFENKIGPVVSKKMRGRRTADGRRTKNFFFVFRILCVLKRETSTFEMGLCF